MSPGAGQARDWYAILGIGPAAGPGEVKSAHRRLAKQWHPDTNSSPGALDRMIELNRARDVLLDPVARAEFDRLRRQWEQKAAARSRVEAAEKPARTVRIQTKVRVNRQQPRPGERDEPRTPEADPKPKRDATGVYRAEPDPTRDWFAFLGVTPQASDGEIRAALRRATMTLQVPGISAVEFARRSAELRTANASIGTAAARAAFQRARDQ